jgi:hypothetical protein
VQPELAKVAAVGGVKDERAAAGDGVQLQAEPEPARSGEADLEVGRAEVAATGRERHRRTYTDVVDGHAQRP